MNRQFAHLAGTNHLFWVTCVRQGQLLLTRPHGGKPVAPADPPNPL